MNRVRSVALAIVVTGLTACSAVTSTDEVRKPAAQRTGFMGLAIADEITVERETPFKSTQKVAIGSFKVGFVHGKIESRKAGGGLFGEGFGGNATAGIKLSGIDETQMQTITDAAYADFVARITQAGYTVVDRKELKAQAEESPQRKTAAFFGDQTEIITLAPTSHDDLYWFLGESDKMGGFGFSNASTAAMTQYAKTGIKVLSVYYVIDFAGSDGYGGKFRNTAAVEVGQALTLAPGGGISIFGGDGMLAANHSGNIKLGQPMYAEEPFGKLVQTTSDTSKGAEVAINVIRTIGGLGTNQRRDFEVQAEAARYGALSQGLLVQANGRLIERMASLR